MLVQVFHIVFGLFSMVVAGFLVVVCCSLFQGDLLCSGCLRSLEFVVLFTSRVQLV